MSVDWSLAGAVILSGLVIVFLILIILICAVAAVSRIVNGVSKKPDAAAMPAPQPKAVAAVPVTPTIFPAPAAPVVQAGIAGETVAAISAAVCAYMDEAAPGVAYAVKSVSRADAVRPVWGFAGMRQNTRPF